MASIAGAVQSYFRIKNVNAIHASQMALLKVNQKQMMQQTQNLLKTLPATSHEHLGNSVDVRV